MPKSDFIPRTDSDFLVWHDQFKTSVLAQAATFGLVAADTTPITNDNTDIHAKVTSVNSPSAIATQAVADKNTSRANANKHARALALTRLVFLSATAWVAMAEVLFTLDFGVNIGVVVGY